MAALGPGGGNGADGGSAEDGGEDGGSRRHLGGRPDRAPRSEPEASSRRTLQRVDGPVDAARRTGRKIGVATVSDEGGVGRDDLGSGARGGTGAVVVGGGGRTGDGIQTKAAGDEKATTVDGRRRRRGRRTMTTDTVRLLLLLYCL